MIYTSKHGTVNFWTPHAKRLNTYTKIGVNLSAGTDSALVMFMLCREVVEQNLNVIIVPITGIDVSRPTNIWNANEIMNLFEEWFPTVRFGEHQVNKYKKLHPQDKTRIHREHEYGLFNKGIIECIFHGRTSNPPEEEATKYNLMMDREVKRDVEYKEVFKGRFYCPLDNVDKRFVADMYNQFNLMKDLYPITASCVSYDTMTDYFTKPCKVCWWCREKKWAFGSYDGGINE